MDTTFTPTPQPLREPVVVAAGVLDRLARISSGALTTRLFKRGYRQPVLTSLRPLQADRKPFALLAAEPADVLSAELADVCEAQDDIEPDLEFRAHRAAPAVKDVPIAEPSHFDYAGRGYCRVPD